MSFFAARPKNLLVNAPPARGLPPRIYLPVAFVVGLLFLGAVAWLVHLGFASGGSVFGSGTGAGTAHSAAARPAPAAVSVEGGPPAGVMLQLRQLRARIARDPRDDVALTQLGDMYLAAGKYREAIPYYRRALAANPKNVAASEGLSQARDGLTDAQ